ncbi:AAA family ATPase [Actinoplanes derwentensis]|uniref:ATPase AAA-type core domain-containing protein n=1 Tax=Actinoplanes derwentensis TaxID=113562 RepID=A0A1H2DBQ2_9ACTN|nr:AAA family ATPase [Actinoplanes derwentensis]GID88541.1 hypothetical protein Ade03nite_74650 [Actinoplanes derwentensis]SDT80017.1 hypothetical protein SAMN04489716_9026 [Actinoplanes derwentensis]
MDFGPFTSIAGANGIGKSNVFDAIEFLSYPASDSLVEAARRVRGASGISGDPRDLFWDGYREHPRQIRLAAEMLVPAEVEDDLGAPTTPTTTFLRYEVTLGYSAADGEGGIGLLKVADETGRRRERVAKRFNQNRRQLLEQLDRNGAVTKLESWQRLVSDIDDIVSRWAAG